MMTEKENFIQLKKSSVFKVEIKDENGKSTNEYLYFDLEDIELPLRVNECEAKHRKNLEWLKSSFIIIDKKEDKKGKYMLSWKEEEKLKTLKEFYLKEMEALDLFLGENGCKKLLNGRKPYYSMYDDINDLLTPLMPKLNVKFEDIKNKIISKYGNVKDSDVLK